MYFESVVEDAIRDVKKNGHAYCFFEEQVKEIRTQLEKENIYVKVKLDDGIFILTKC